VTTNSRFERLISFEGLSPRPQLSSLFVASVQLTFVILFPQIRTLLLPPPAFNFVFPRACTCTSTFSSGRMDGLALLCLNCLSLFPPSLPIGHVVRNSRMACCHCVRPGFSAAGWITTVRRLWMAWLCAVYVRGGVTRLDTVIPWHRTNGLSDGTMLLAR
jgi:hypothetical protein